HHRGRHGAGDASGIPTDSPSPEFPGLRAGTPVITGTIDAWAESVSVDATRPGVVMLMYGTTAFLVATTRSAVPSRTLWAASGTGPGPFTISAGRSTSGAMPGRLREHTGPPGFGRLIHEAQQSGVGGGCLVMLPYSAGERAPIADPDARGMIAGLTLSHTRGDLYRAALEAAAYGVRHHLE